MFLIHLMFPSVGDQNQPCSAASLLLFKPLVNQFSFGVRRPAVALLQGYFDDFERTYTVISTHALTKRRQAVALQSDHFFENL